MRGRPIAGTALSSSFPAMFVSHNVLAHMYSLSTFKGGDESVVADALDLGNNLNLRIYDTAVSDMTQPALALRDMDEALLNSFGMAGLLAVFPSHCPLLAVGQGEGVWYGNPFDDTTWRLSYVIASGDPGTTWKTTLLNTAPLIVTGKHG